MCYFRFICLRVVIRVDLVVSYWVTQWLSDWRVMAHSQRGLSLVFIATTLKLPCETWQFEQLMAVMTNM